MGKKLLAAAVLLVALSSGCSVISPDSTKLSLAISPVITARQPVDEGGLYAPAPAPDLIIESIIWTPTAPSQADAVTISVTVKNQGDAQALPSRINFYVDGHLKQYLDIPSVSAGATLVRGFNWTAEAGSHDIKATIDEENWIAESNDSNNDKTVSIVTLAPDLVIQVVGWSPLTPREGDNVTFTVTVKNQGTGRANSSRVAFYVDNSNLLHISLEPIEPGEMASGNFSWSAQPGITTVKLVADPYSGIVESDESNNEYFVDFPLLLPDLVIQNLTWVPVNPSLGSTVNFTVSISNWGTAGSDPSRLHYYIGSSFTDYLDVPGINAGGTVNLGFTWTAQAGSRDVRVVVDPFDTITETKEENNERTGTFAGAVLPDLLVQSITFSPLESSAGEKVTFNVTVKNVGNGRSPDFHIDYYVGDARITTSAVDSLASGVIVNTSFTWTFQDGSHVVRAVADASKEVIEINEDNNEQMVIYPVSADLVIPSITWLPEKPEAGDNITFIVTMENQGTGQAGPSSVTQYIDDVYLAFALTDPLAAGAASNITFYWAGPTGLHTVRVVADPHAKVLESDESNNEKKVTFNIYFPTVSADESPGETAPAAAAPSRETPPVAPKDNNLMPGGNNLILWLAIIPLVGLGVSFYLLLKSRRQE